MDEIKTKRAFGQAVRSLREAAGMSQESLGDLAGIHRNYVGDVERGERNIALINIARLAEALGVSSSQLIRKMEDHLKRK